MVTRAGLSFTLYVHCVSCYLSHLTCLCDDDNGGGDDDAADDDNNIISNDNNNNTGRKS